MLCVLYLWCVDFIFSIIVHISRCQQHASCSSELNIGVFNVQFIRVFAHIKFCLDFLLDRVYMCLCVCVIRHGCMLGSHQILFETASKVAITLHLAFCMRQCLCSFSSIIEIIQLSCMQHCLKGEFLCIQVHSTYGQQLSIQGGV